MTRIERFQTLRARVLKENQENAELWDLEQKLANYQTILLKINHDYFQSVISKVKDNLNLLNLETTMVKNNYHFLREKDKFYFKKLLENINQTFNNYQYQFEDETNDITLVQYPIEYTTLISNMHQKIVEFEKNLASKINDINIFVKNLEKKYQKNTLSQNFEHSYAKFKEENFKLQESFNQLKAQGRINFKFSSVLFGIIIFALIMIVILIILFLMLK